MSSFELRVSPALPGPSQLIRDLDFDKIDRSELIERNDSIELTYVVDGKEFGYYPSNALVALDDIYSELDRLRSGEEHYVTLSGYQILFLSIDHDRVVFRDPDNAGGAEPHGAVVGALRVSEVENQLVETASALIEFTGALKQAS